jgi:hypothetical protein
MGRNVSHSVYMDAGIKRVVESDRPGLGESLVEFEFDVDIPFVEEAVVTVRGAAIGRDRK